MINDDIKNKVKLTLNMYHRYLSHKRNSKDFAKLEDLRNEINNIISKFKKEYYQNINRKLSDLSTSRKTYWSIMKTFFNGKKVPAIPPLLFNGAFVTDSQEKANNSVLPSEFMMDERLYSITFSESDVLK